MDMEAMIAANAPPETPLGAVENTPKLISFFRKFDAVGTASILAGLQTFPNHQANYRLEWAARLALALGSGNALPNAPQLRTLLNDLLEKSRVNRLEDPLEDVMVSAIPTARGDFRLLTGLWEKAAHHTESVLRAFERLPGDDQKDVALARAYALLEISDLICERSNLAANAMGMSNPRKPIPLTGAGLLASAKTRVEFGWEELAALGLSREILSPFFIEPTDFSRMTEKALGDSQLEFQPIVEIEGGIAVIAPTNLSTAVRGHLIDVAIGGGQQDALRRKLLLVHSEIIATGGFTRIVGSISRFGQDGFCRDHIERLCPGRYVHAIQVIDGFGAWPKNAFCADSDLGNNAFGNALTEAITRAQAEIEAKDDFVAGVSFAMRRSELRMALNGQDEQLRDLAPLIDRYTMPCRNGWTAILAGSTARDYDLAKFDRRFSLIGRPIVAIDDDEDPLLMVAPAVVERAMFHNLGGALTGGLQNEFWSSREMQKFASRRGDETGLAFNDDLARDLTSLGLEAHASANLTWCLNHQGTEEVKRLGDVDVLVISPDRTRVWVIEAKDLKMCRTLGETARRLSEYQGKTKSNGKPDNLMKHLTRVEYVRKHAIDLQKRFGLAEVPSVSGMIVVGSPQPMEMIKIPGGKDAITIRKDDLANVRWNGT